MKILFLTLVLTRLLQSCTVLPDFEFATIEEQIDYASIILSGTVVSVSDPINEATIILDIIENFKGCLNKNSVEISGFRGSSLCGPGIP